LRQNIPITKPTVWCHSSCYMYCL